MSRDDKNKSPRAKRREDLKRRRRLALPFFTLLFAVLTLIVTMGMQEPQRHTDISHHPTNAGDVHGLLNLAGLTLRAAKWIVHTPMALATVALVQVSQFVTTILLLLAVALATGSSGALDQLPSTAVLIAILGVVVLVGSTLFFPTIRHWVLAKTMPTLRQVWPRLVWVVGQPGRLAMGIGGNLIMTVGYVAAFGLTLLAFGESIPLTSLAIIYLAGNAAGSAIPTPGGVGTVDVALAAGLRTASVAAGTALSVALIFRVLTFWGRVPLGWLALRSLQKRNLV